MEHSRINEDRHGKVVGFGAVAVDELIYLEAPLSAGKGRILARERLYGGNVGTGLAAAATLGGKTSFIGFLPDQVEWKDVYEDLQALGIETINATESVAAAPIRSTILVGPDGDRFIAFDDDVPIGAPEDLELGLVTTAGAVLLDGYGPEAGLRAASAARSAGVPVIGDIERSDGASTEALMQQIDHLVVPLGFALQLTGERDGETAVNALWTDDKSAIVVTDGENGSWHRSHSDEQVHHTPAFKIDVVDTTGCGDIFHGTYALAVAEGLSTQEAVLFASAAAALGATGRGGRGHLPSRVEVDNMIKSGPRAPVSASIP